MLLQLDGIILRLTVERSVVKLHPHAVPEGILVDVEGIVTVEQKTVFSRSFRVIVDESSLLSGRHTENLHLVAEVGKPLDFLAWCVPHGWQDV